MVENVGVGTERTYIGGGEGIVGWGMDGNGYFQFHVGRYCW